MNIANADHIVQTFRNEKCIISFDPRTKEISGTDLTDKYNDPRCYNKTTRGFNKALQALSRQWNAEITMYGAMHVISEAGVQMRSYCAMD